MNSTLFWGIIGVLATILVAYLFYRLARIQSIHQCYHTVF